ncbi:hypothetical protein MHY87_14600 [Microvirga sp. ACRRW]|uniref:hypothetical protein n=1 Tax=Microvirga sp. ACRRW TaxID=2918205 RepID=UPI001EF5EA8E|nr:hypothetical protein [Microvirga sp. ACRRW]MCG7394135.1 hypothetical protein [Microvirga sp. ACRRW]
MRIRFPKASRTPSLLLAVLVAANVTACAGGSNPVRDIAGAVGAGPQVAATPDFVASSRPQNLDYMPIGTPVEGRPTPARSPDEIKAAESELDALRNRNEAAGAAAAKLGGTPPPEPITLPVNTPQNPRKKTNSKPKR